MIGWVQPVLFRRHHVRAANGPRLQARHPREPVLLENGAEVGFGHIVGEGAITEDDVRIARGGELHVPCNNAERQRFNLGGGDLRCEADEQRASADAVDSLPAICFSTIGTVRSRPSLSSSSKRMSCSVRSVLRCSIDP